MEKSCLRYSITVSSRVITWPGYWHLIGREVVTLSLTQIFELCIPNIFQPSKIFFPANISIQVETHSLPLIGRQAWHWALIGWEGERCVRRESFNCEPSPPVIVLSNNFPIICNFSVQLFHFSGLINSLEIVLFLSDCATPQLESFFCVNLTFAPWHLFHLSLSSLDVVNVSLEVVASDWSRVITWHMSWPLIGH